MIFDDEEFLSLESFDMERAKLSDKSDMISDDYRCDYRRIQMGELKGWIKSLKLTFQCFFIPLIL